MADKKEENLHEGHRARLKKRFLENGFEEVEKCTLTSISFLRNHQKNGELLHGLEIEQLQIIHTQLVLFPEDVPYKGFNVRKLSLF